MRLPDPRDRPWLTVDEVAEITGEGPKVIRAAMAAGQLPRLVIGRYHRCPTAQLYELLHMTPNVSEEAESPSASVATAAPDTTGAQPHDRTADVRHIGSARAARLGEEPDRPRPS